MPNEAPIQTLINIMAALRTPQTGCPWDQEQDFASIAPYTIEEAYEVRAAIEANDPAQLKDELGDLLFNIVFHAQLAQERGWFDFNDIAAAVSQKMIRRHPHVFANQPPNREGWEAQKALERRILAQTGTLDGVATALPALKRAQKLTSRAARVKFDWPDAAAVLAKLDEESAELKAELAEAKPERLADELGDMLFVLVNLARKLGLDAETCLDGANAKFTRRFNRVEAMLATCGKTPQDSSLDEMEQFWANAKKEGL